MYTFPRPDHEIGLAQSVPEAFQVVIHTDTQNTVWFNTTGIDEINHIYWTAGIKLGEALILTVMNTILAIV